MSVSSSQKKPFINSGAGTQKCLECSTASEAKIERRDTFQTRLCSKNVYIDAHLPFIDTAWLMAQKASAWEDWEEISWTQRS